MISMTEIDSASDAASYYTSHGRAEYYAEEQVPSQWGGRGAARSGLTGQVGADALTMALEGRLEVDGHEVLLGRTVTNEFGEKVREHRAGWDMTFAPSKSVSVEAEVFGRTDVRDAHETAVRVAMEYLEQHAAQTRVNGEVVQTGNLTYAMFSHATSREGDPQTHTHVVVANVTYDERGQAYSLSNEKLLQYRVAADAVYKNELAYQLQGIGYSLEFDSKGNFEVAGYSREDVLQFSKRAQAIEGHLAERGTGREQASYEARQVAALDSRAAKNHPESADAHRERWRLEAGAAGIAPAERADGHQVEIPVAHGLASEPEGAARPTARHDVSAQVIVADAISSLGEREAVFGHKALVVEAARSSAGRVSSRDLFAAIETEGRDGQLVSRAGTRSEARYTTQAAVAREQWADNALREVHGAHLAVMTSAEVLRALADFERGKGFTLTDEQREAATSILTGRDQAEAVQGSAGTGKTTMLEFVRLAAESKGWEVVGMSNGAAQAAKLEADSGIRSTTVASFLARRDGQTGDDGARRVLYVNDEASLSSQKEFNDVLQAARAAGAKVLFVGDQHQLQSVGAGSAFERAQAQLQTSTLAQINRQKTDQAKAPVAAVVAGDHARAIESVAAEYASNRSEVLARWDRLAEKQGSLTKKQTATRREQLQAASVADNARAIDALAADYAALTPAERERTIVVTGTNADRAALNESIRERLVARGELGAAEVRVEALKAKA